MGVHSVEKYYQDNKSREKIAKNAHACGWPCFFYKRLNKKNVEEEEREGQRDRRGSSEREEQKEVSV